MRKSATLLIFSILLAACGDTDEGPAPSCDHACSEDERSCEGVLVRTCVEDAEGCLAWSEPAPCGEGLVCFRNDCVDPDDASDLAVQIAFPFLLEIEEREIFPTYLAHLLGSELPEDALIDTDLACYLVENQSDRESFDLILSVNLEGFAVAASETLRVAPLSSRSLCLNPSPDFGALYSLTEPVAGRIKATVQEQAGTVLAAENFPVEISPANYIFFGDEEAMLLDYVAVMSMPNSPDVLEAFTQVDRRSRLPQRFGVGPYTAVGEWFAAREVEVEADGAATRLVFLEADETMEFQLLSVEGDDENVDLMIYDEANFARFSKGEPAQGLNLPGLKPDLATEFTAPEAGIYAFVFSGPEGAARSFSWRRTVTLADPPLDVLRSIYDELQSRGLDYLDISEAFFESSQYVRWPAQSLKDKAANCIDGTLLFTSFAERAAVDPVVIIVPGHAFVGVRSRAEGEPPGEGRIWPVETTLLGEHDFDTALNYAQQELAEALAEDEAYIIDLRLVRSQGIRPIPR